MTRTPGLSARLRLTRVPLPAATQYGVKCWDGDDYSTARPTAEWRRVTAMAAAVIIIYPVGVPALYLLLLFGSTSPTVQQSMGFLTDNYRPSVRWWELAEVFKRTLLAGIAAG